jgi:hypothetical protein
VCYDSLPCRVSSRSLALPFPTLESSSLCSGLRRKRRNSTQQRAPHANSGSFSPPTSGDPASSRARRLHPPDRLPSCRGKSRLGSRPPNSRPESRGFRGRASRFLIAWLLVNCAIRRWILGFRVLVSLVAAPDWRNFGGRGDRVGEGLDFGEASMFLRGKSQFSGVV